LFAVLNGIIGDSSQAQAAKDAAQGRHSDRDGSVAGGSGRHSHLFDGKGGTSGGSSGGGGKKAPPKVMGQCPSGCLC
jgi:hypothetical protein